MRHLNEFLDNRILNGLVSEGKVTAGSIIDTLGNIDKNAKLGKYVETLNNMLKDDDAKLILTKLFGSKSIQKEHKVAFDGEMIEIKASELHPTQSEIDVNKSIIYPFLNPDNAKAVKAYKENKTANFPFPLITFDGKWVVDGHHRWSGVYTFNPDCPINCYNLKVSSNEPGAEITQETVLKIVQACLAAKRAEDGKGQIPQEKVEGVNVFKLTPKKIAEIVKSFCTGEVFDELSDKEKSKAGSPENMQKAAKAVAKNLGFEGDDQNDYQETIAYITGNLKKLQKENKQYAQTGNPRGDMPQTDKGGNDPDNDKTATPDTEGSALNKLVDNGVDIKAVPHNEK